MNDEIDEFEEYKEIFNKNRISEQIEFIKFRDEFYQIMFEDYKILPDSPLCVSEEFIRRFWKGNRPWEIVAMVVTNTHLTKK
jgi:hypothetical protein